MPRVLTFDNNLEVFLGELRDFLFSSQEVAGRYFHLHRSRISRYETGNSNPKPGYVAGLIQQLASNPIMNQMFNRRSFRKLTGLYRNLYLDRND